MITESYLRMEEKESERFTVISEILNYSDAFKSPLFIKWAETGVYDRAGEFVKLEEKTRNLLECGTGDSTLVIEEKLRTVFYERAYAGFELLAMSSEMRWPRLMGCSKNQDKTLSEMENEMRDQSGKSIEFMNTMPFYKRALKELKSDKYNP